MAGRPRYRRTCDDSRVTVSDLLRATGSSIGVEPAIFARIQASRCDMRSLTDERKAPTTLMLLLVSQKTARTRSTYKFESLCSPAVGECCLRSQRKESRGNLIFLSPTVFFSLFLELFIPSRPSAIHLVLDLRHLSKCSCKRTEISSSAR